MGQVSGIGFQKGKKATIIPAMGAGLFLDDLILGVVRSVRRQMRKAAAEKWLLVEGKINRFTAEDEAWNDFRPRVVYSYEVNGETEYGTVLGCPLNRKSVDRIGDAVDALSSIKVRFNPEDHGLSRVLNEDNPSLPFEVDHNEG